VNKCASDSQGISVLKDFLLNPMPSQMGTGQSYDQVLTTLKLDEPSFNDSIRPTCLSVNKHTFKQQSS
jgi:hypothetical protein